MNFKEELTKIGLGKIVTGILFLIGFLCVAAWQVFLSGRWAQVVEALSKQMLVVLLGLVVLIGLLIIGALTGLVLHYRKQLKTQPAPLPTSPKPKKVLTSSPEFVTAYGVLWDAVCEPYCSVCRVPLHTVTTGSGTVWHACPKCGMWYEFKTDIGARVDITTARSKAQQVRYFIKHPPDSN